MSDRPKAAAGMVWLPECASNHLRAEWVAVTEIKYIGDDERVEYEIVDGRYIKGPDGDPVVTSRVRGVFVDSRWLPGISAATVLEVIAEAWAQRGGKP